MREITSKIEKGVILLLALAILLSVPVVGQELNFPMFFHGKVINEDTMTPAPAGALVIAETDTGEIIRDRVDEDGRYGEPVNQRLMIPQCDSFELKVDINGEQVSLGTQQWSSGEVKKMDIYYSLEGPSNGGNGGRRAAGGGGGGGSIITEVTPTPTPAPGPVTSPERVTTQTPGEPEETFTPSVEPVESPTMVPETPEEVPWWQQPTNIILMVILVIAVVSAALYYSMMRGR